MSKGNPINTTIHQRCVRCSVSSRRLQVPPLHCLWILQSPNGKARSEEAQMSRFLLRCLLLGVECRADAKACLRMSHWSARKWEKVCSVWVRSSESSTQSVPLLWLSHCKWRVVVPKRMRICLQGAQSLDFTWTRLWKQPLLEILMPHYLQHC